jgi:hypothetical protein
MNNNLPPGVTEGMIPGNRPQDIEWEQLIDAIAVFIEDGLDRAEYHDREDTPDILRALWEEMAEGKEEIER